MSNVIKLTTPFETLKSHNTSPDIALRRAIIMQAIIDATNVSTCPKAKKIEREAKEWLFGNDEFFKNTCIEAQIEPSLVVKLTKELIKLHKNKTEFLSSSVKSKHNTHKRHFPCS